MFDSITVKTSGTECSAYEIDGSSLTTHAVHINPNQVEAVIWNAQQVTMKLSADRSRLIVVDPDKAVA